MRQVMEWPLEKFTGILRVTFMAENDHTPPFSRLSRHSSQCDFCHHYRSGTKGKTADRDLQEGWLEHPVTLLTAQE